MNEIKTESSLRILFVPDTIWGNSSGHRSAQMAVKIFCDLNYKVGVYAPNVNSSELKTGLKEYHYEFYNRTPFRYYHLFAGRSVQVEFKKVIEDFKPDVVYYFGTTGFSPSAKVCVENKIPYTLQFLTTDYYCIKNFAALEDGPCVKCINGKYYNAVINNCQQNNPKFFHYLKDIANKVISRKYILKASKILGYSYDQISLYKEYGIKSTSCRITPVFFDRSHLKGLIPILGDYFLMTGQNIVGKGWHTLPSIISQCPGVKFKLLFYNKNIADSSIDLYNLKPYIESGQAEIVVGLEKHDDVLKLIANARGVLVPSYYATTGEFVLLESLGLGKPVLTFDAGIHKEIIEHKINGMIAKVGDFKQFSININEVNSNDDLCRKLSIGALELFEKLTLQHKFKAPLEHLFNGL